MVWASPARRQTTLLLAFLLISAVPAERAEELERRGNAAFDDGKFAQAIASYDQAESASNEPGRVAFNHGTALFQLGKYREAERFFRASLEGAAPPERRARALYNLGTSLMHVADGRDADRLAEAISCFSRCLTMADGNDELHSDARHNLEAAKLLWRRIRSSDVPPPERDPTNPNDERGPEKPPDRDTSDDPGTNAGSPNGTGSQRPIAAQPAPNGPQPILTSHAPPPGAGHAQPIPDAEQLQPLTPNEARDLLRLAEERIARERRALQRAGAPGEGKNYPDW